MKRNIRPLPCPKDSHDAQMMALDHGPLFAIKSEPPWLVWTKAGQHEALAREYRRQRFDLLRRMEINRAMTAHGTDPKRSWRVPNWPVSLV